MKNHNNLSDIGVIGLGVMGKNLALNIADNGYRVSAFDVDSPKINALVTQAHNESPQLDPHRILGCLDIKQLLASLDKPRVIVLSVPAGDPVDGVCAALMAAGIETDDIVIDTGNSLWTDTIARELSYQGQFIFFSSAVSGGEVGARFGPSLMPSGDPRAWARVAPIWRAIAAKVDNHTGLPIERFEPGVPVTEGEPCTTYIGPSGAGHYVKMVHNGIEYADMQLICEAYHVLSDGLGMSAAEVGAVFAKWAQGQLNSYLMEISADILQQADPLTDKPLVEMILDTAGQKGTGLWTAVSSLHLGCPAPTIAEAVYARAVSTQKTLRSQLNGRLQGVSPSAMSDDERAALVDILEDAIYCAKVCCYAQGFQLMAMTAAEQGWQLDFAAIAKIWRAGCIIRATFLQSIVSAYQTDEQLEHLLLAETFATRLSNKQPQWRQAVSTAVLRGIPVPCISSALAYYDSYRAKTLPANLLQAQRDYFGAHTFARIDSDPQQKFHLDWSGDRSLKSVP
ncbi:NADP-dependent phosphogluconate dehydrogenase [Shewanella sp. NIFS-20-20]|uniref:NADP-dependent phosphogluconate dehydrogenase n=1 Tax=Shewanella sp. NIFS-20-20 TaxID=2853806 RepID=UPI001C437D30|nr:NADP-dependent phosphogluconate dehydrogenase [Shewanella sp. NIFS-20-20]MBV7317284.1 NADP-dependent phosphogluconate dehydrogenase [Shewanella sp. NIFS-20-20]